MKRVDLLFNEAVSEAALRSKIPEHIVEELTISNTRAHLLVNRGNLNALLKILSDVQFTNIDITSPDLEEIFLKFYHNDPTSVKENVTTEET